MTHNSSRITVNNVTEMQVLAGKMAAIAKIGDWIALNGDLGVGKTIFAKGFLAALNFDGEVSSPSYALVHSYDPPAVPIHISHVDLYRIENDYEYQELGLEDVTNYGIILVEWADKYSLPLPANRFEINIIKISENIREVTLNIWGDGITRWT